MQNLNFRWTLVREWRVVESDEPVNCKFENGRLIPWNTLAGDPAAEDAAL